MNSEIKTLLPSLINYINSDLFTLSSISSSITLSTQESSSDDKHSWDAVVSYLPLKFYRIIESYPNMITYESFNKKRKKQIAFEEYDYYEVLMKEEQNKQINKQDDVVKEM